MKAVGVRELKNRLSEYLRAVRGGERVLVTDRGEVVAELRAPGPDAADVRYGGIRDLVRRGAARMGAPNAPEAYPLMPAVLSPGDAVRLIDEERRE